MNIEKTTNPMQLIIGKTHISFTHFETTKLKSHVMLMKDNGLAASLYDEDAQEFIKLMEQG